MIAPDGCLLHISCGMPCSCDLLLWWLDPFARDALGWLLTPTGNSFVDSLLSRNACPSRASKTPEVVAGGALCRVDPHLPHALS